MLHLATKCNKLNDHIQYCLREIFINFSAFVHSLFNSTSCSADNNCFTIKTRSANVTFYSWTRVDLIIEAFNT